MNSHNQRQHEKAMARARKVAKLRNAGKTFPQIGNLFDITPQRAQQLYAVATALKNVE